MQKIRGYKDCRKRPQVRNVYFKAPKGKKSNPKKIINLLKRIGGLITILSIIISGIKIYDYVTSENKFLIKNIEVNYTNKDYINKILREHDIVIGRNIFKAELGSVEKSLKLNFNLYNIRVSRKFPDTIIISAEDRIPIAYINNASYQVDREYVITMNNVKNNDIPVILGVDLRQDEIGKKTDNKNLIAGLKFLETVNKYKSANNSNIKNIKEINVNNIDSLEIKTIDGVSIIFGDGKFEKKIRRLEALFTDLVSKGKNAVSVDLRFRNEASVKIR